MPRGADADMSEFVRQAGEFFDNGGLSTLLIIAGVLILLLAFCRWILIKMKMTPENADRTLSQIDNMTGSQFEEFVAAVLEGNGYTIIEMTSATGDYGADIIAERNEVRIAVQCKRYAKPVGVKAVQEAISAMKHYECDSCLVVTNNRFTRQAMVLASDNEVVGLWDRNILITMRDRAQK